MGRHQARVRALRDALHNRLNFNFFSSVAKSACETRRVRRERLRASEARWYRPFVGGALPRQSKKS